MIQFPHLPIAYPLAGTKGLSPWWEKTKLCSALWNRFFLSHRHSFMARSCKTAKCSMNTLGPVPCRWLCPSAWPEIQGEGKKTSLQFLSKRWLNSSYAKAEPTANNRKKLKRAMWTAERYRCGLGPGRAKLNASGVERGATLIKRTDWQKTWFELLWLRETCSYLARAPPAGRGAERRFLVQLQTGRRYLWIRPARGKEL